MAFNVFSYVFLLVACSWLLSGSCTAPVPKPVTPQHALKGCCKGSGKGWRRRWKGRKIRKAARCFYALVGNGTHVEAKRALLINLGYICVYSSLGGCDHRHATL